MTAVCSTAAVGKGPETPRALLLPRTSTVGKGHE